MDRLGFWGTKCKTVHLWPIEFQYPLMDRLGFWGNAWIEKIPTLLEFQYPLMDRLGFWGQIMLVVGASQAHISVSADGSTWFLGVVVYAGSNHARIFQYPLMDRLGFWGLTSSRSAMDLTCHFSIR